MSTTPATMFPLWFAGAAIAMTASNLINSRIVERLGMRKISHTALIAFVIVSAIHAAFALAGPVDFTIFYTLLIAAFFCIGFQGPNYNAIGMERLGALAGSGAALIGFASSFVSASIGGLDRAAVRLHHHADLRWPFRSRRPGPARDLHHRARQTAAIARAGHTP